MNKKKSTSVEQKYVQEFIDTIKNKSSLINSMERQYFENSIKLIQQKLNAGLISQAQKQMNNLLETENVNFILDKELANIDDNSDIQKTREDKERAEFNHILNLARKEQAKKIHSCKVENYTTGLYKNPKITEHILKERKKLLQEKTAVDEAINDFKILFASTIKRMKKKSNKKLKESLSKVVFHNTYIKNLYDILISNEFYLTTNLGTTSDQLQKSFYYFSVSRIKFGGYANTLLESDNVNLVLDGDKLNQRYRGGPVDYWTRSMRSGKGIPIEMQLRNDENEERIISNKSEIDDAIKYILEIHISLGSGEMYEHKYFREIREIIKLCGINDIPLFLYNDYSAFKVLDKRKALEGYGASVSYIQAIIDICNMNKIEDIPQDYPYKSIKNALYYAGGMYFTDTITQIQNDIHNHKTDPVYRPLIAELTRTMKKLGVGNIKELMLYLVNRFKKEEKKIKHKSMVERIKHDRKGWI